MMDLKNERKTHNALIDSKDIFSFSLSDTGT